MKKILQNILSVLLLMSTLGGVVGCNKPGQPDSSSGSNSEQSDSSGVELTEKKIIDKGQAYYDILIPANAKTYEHTAASELSFFLMESTGVQLSIVKDNQKVAGKKYISIGDTNLAESYGLKGDYKTLGLEGFYAKTVEENLFIYAANDRGVLNGVYELLEKLLNYDYYFTDIYDIDKTSTLYLPDLDMYEVPDIETRIASSCYQLVSSSTQLRMRVQPFDNTFAGPSYHNWPMIIPPETYQETHPKWFATHATVTQLCYTAKGDAAELAALQAASVEVMYDWLMEYPDRNIVHMGMADDHNWCQCTACDTDKKTYGSYSASLVKFFNGCAALLKDKLVEANDPRVDLFKISFFAYFDVEDAPVTIEKDVNGNYVYQDGKIVCHYADEMKMDEHVVPFYAPYYADYTQDFYSEANKDYLDALIGWDAIADSLIVWTYDQYYFNYAVPYNSFAATQSLFKALKEVGVSWHYVEGQMEQRTPISFSSFKSYLNSKYGWDVDEDYADLKYRFFKAMYGSEYETILRVFDEFCLTMKRANTELGLSTVVGTSALYEREYWPKNLLASWISTMEDSMAKLKAEGKDKLADNVRVESLNFIYLMLKVHGSLMTTEDYQYYKALLVKNSKGTHILRPDMSAFIQELD